MGRKTKIKGKEKADRKLGKKGGKDGREGKNRIRKEEKEKEERKKKEKEGRRKKNAPPMAAVAAMGGACVAYVYWLFDTGVSIRDVTWEGAVAICAGKSFSCGVLPGAKEVIICADEFEVDTSGEGG